MALTLDQKIAIRRKLKPLLTAVDWIVGQISFGLMKLLRLVPADTASDICGGFLRRVGPLIPAHKTGQKNLAAAFPEKSAAEREAILDGVWDNLGRVAGEFVHLDKLWDYDPARPNTGRIETATAHLYDRLRDDGKPALVFAAHLANWELPAVAAAAHGLDATAVFRTPNNRFLAEAIYKIRGGLMGGLLPSGPEAPFAMARVLDNGGHLAQLVDQHLTKGVEVTFFGRKCKANPTLARLARHYDCPVHGVRVIRLPDHRFRVEVTEALELPRDASGRIEVKGAAQMMTSVVEEWVREHPEQWLWLHRRWR